MAESTDLPHRCVLEVASKNDFKTCRNCQALRKCSLKTHKLVKIEEKTSSKLFFLVCFKEVGVVSAHVGLIAVNLGKKNKLGHYFSIARWGE